MVKKKKSIELTLKTVIIAILVLILLLLSIVVFKEKFQEGTEKLNTENNKNIDEIAEEIIESAKNA